VPKEPQKGVPRKPTVPPDFAVTPPPPLPSGDYSYTLEIVMEMQNTLGGLTEATGALKAQSKAHGEKLESIGNDIHTAKVVIGVVGAFIGGVGVFLGIVLKSLLDYLIRTHFK
jgi:hypothetical protein